MKVAQTAGANTRGKAELELRGFTHFLIQKFTPLIWLYCVEFVVAYRTDSGAKTRARGNATKSGLFYMIYVLP